jgi:hypothetical protein
MKWSYAPKTRIPGICTYCNEIITKRSVIKHLEKCSSRLGVLQTAETSDRPVETLWCLRVQDAYDKDFWLYLEMRGSVTLTPLGERFLVAPAPLQVWLLLVTWWRQINWAIASPFGYGDGYLPAKFSRLTLTHLLDLPADAQVAFDSFANGLINAARLVWPTENPESVTMILQAVVERVVVDPLADFGILVAQYEPHKTLGEEFRELSAFQVTPFGKALLETIKEVIGES